jgi:hypothetical protein
MVNVAGHASLAAAWGGLGQLVVSEVKDLLSVTSLMTEAKGAGTKLARTHFRVVSQYAPFTFIQVCVGGRLCEGM